MKYVIFYYKDDGKTTKTTIFASSEEEAKTVLKKDIPNSSIIKILESEGPDKPNNPNTPESANPINYKVVYHFGGRTGSTIVSADTPEEAEKIILSKNSFRTIVETNETDEPVYGEKTSPEHSTPHPITQPTVVNLSDASIEKLADAIASKHSAKNSHKSKQIISINEIDITFGNIFGIILKASIAAIPVYVILALIAAALISGIR